MQQKNKAKAKADDFDLLIGQTLKKIRIIRGFSQQELAEKSLVTFQQIQKYENGKNRVSVSRLHKILNKLEIEPAEFFDIIDEKKENNKIATLNFIDDQSLRMLSLFQKIENKDIRNNIIIFIQNLIKQH